MYLYKNTNTCASIINAIYLLTIHILTPPPLLWGVLTYLWGVLTRDPVPGAVTLVLCI